MLMKKTIFGFALLVYLVADVVHAQTSVSVNINKAKLSWQWTQGTGGVADGFNIKCGNTTGNYTKITTINNPTARTADVKDAITGSGQWFCIVTAFNQFDESAGASEVSFFAGDGPSAPTNLTIQAQ